jgi:hypothetical protein
MLATSGGDCVIAWSFTGRGPMGSNGRDYCDFLLRR